MQFIYKQWRVVATGLSFVVFGAGAFVIGSLLLIVLWPLPLAEQSKRRLTRSTIRVAARAYIVMMWLLGLLSFQVRNAKAFTQPGELIVANHPSLLDMVFLLALMPAPCCIVKGALVRNPFTRSVIKLAGYIPNSGDAEHLLQQAVEVLARGEALVIFPEGTRTPDPTQLQLRRGAANIALAARCPIRPVVIHVCPPTLRKHQPWYDVPDTRPRFTLTALDVVDVNEPVDVQCAPGLQARQLNRYLHAVLSRQL